MRRACLLIAATFLLAAPAAEAVPRKHVSKSCGVVSKGSRDYRAKGRAMACRHARKWVRAYLRNGRRAPGFSCTRTRGKVRFYCKRGSAKAYWAERL